MTNNSAGEVIEDTSTMTGMWAEGIFYGLTYTVPIVIMMAIVVGVTMGAGRYSIRKMESLFRIGGNQ